MLQTPTIKIASCLFLAVGLSLVSSDEDEPLLGIADTFTEATQEDPVRHTGSSIAEQIQLVNRYLHMKRNVPFRAPLQPVQFTIPPPPSRYVLRRIQQPQQISSQPVDYAVQPKIRAALGTRQQSRSLPVIIKPPVYPQIPTQQTENKSLEVATLPSSQLSTNPLSVNEEKAEETKPAKRSSPVSTLTPNLAFDVQQNETKRNLLARRNEPKSSIPLTFFPLPAGVEHLPQLPEPEQMELGLGNLNQGEFNASVAPVTFFPLLEDTHLQLARAGNTEPMTENSTSIQLLTNETHQPSFLSEAVQPSLRILNQSSAGLSLSGRSAPLVTSFLPSSTAATAQQELETTAAQLARQHVESETNSTSQPEQDATVAQLARQYVESVSNATSQPEQDATLAQLARQHVEPVTNSTTSQPEQDVTAAQLARQYVEPLTNSTTSQPEQEATVAQLARKHVVLVTTSTSQPEQASTVAQLARQHVDPLTTSTTPQPEQESTVAKLARQHAEPLSNSTTPQPEQDTAVAQSARQHVETEKESELQQSETNETNSPSNLPTSAPTQTEKVELAAQMGRQADLSFLLFPTRHRATTALPAHRYTKTKKMRIQRHRFPNPQSGRSALTESEPKKVSNVTNSEPSQSPELSARKGELVSTTPPPSRPPTPPPSNQADENKSKQKSRSAGIEVPTTTMKTRVSPTPKQKRSSMQIYRRIKKGSAETQPPAEKNQKMVVRRKDKGTAQTPSATPKTARQTSKDSNKIPNPKPEKPSQAVKADGVPTRRKKQQARIYNAQQYGSEVRQFFKQLPLPFQQLPQQFKQGQGPYQQMPQSFQQVPKPFQQVPQPFQRGFHSFEHAPQPFKPKLQGNGLLPLVLVPQPSAVPLPQSLLNEEHWQQLLQLSDEEDLEHRSSVPRPRQPPKTAYHRKRTAPLKARG